ncbi:ferric reductase-like transmembrane domain-containing protein [Blastococcus sp. URHD0036]|uniref:ferredoxin reductase family protein n=1 Tax=Blastococcus sp. URHD0036 TaxID=1380356 RepID=UPI00068C4E8E|nr:ferric reductase-like transmembrane domain-containing protein [Blastococcus sp. URHD0036]
MSPQPAPPRGGGRHAQARVAYAPPPVDRAAPTSGAYPVVERRPRRAAPTSGGRATAWVAAHIVLGLTPLALCFGEAREGRGFVVNLSVALGFVALSVLGLQFALAARFTGAAAPFGIDAVLRYHRQISFLAVVAAFGHPVLLFCVSDHYRRLLDVVHDPLRAKLAWLSVVALLALMVTSIWRRALRISYPVWHVLHSALGVVIVLAGLGHAFGVHYYFGEPLVRLVWLLYAAAFLWLAVWVRLVKPLMLWRRRFRVAELWPEPGGSVTVGLEPARRHARPFRFRAGQFAWILPGRSPFTLTYHPFSMSSSTHSSRVEFTIKQVGDFTDSIRGLRVGDTVYVDGPHGSFTLERHPGMGFVFIAAGVGVTPFLSMLSTLADQGDQRPCTLVLANRYEDQVTGVRQLARLQGRLNLRVVHVISRPSDQWEGVRGHVDAALLERLLPQHRRSLQYFICSGGQMVEAVEDYLDWLDVPRDRIHSEKFGMV